MEIDYRKYRTDDLVELAKEHYDEGVALFNTCKSLLKANPNSKDAKALEQGVKDKANDLSLEAAAFVRGFAVSYEYYNNIAMHLDEVMG